MKEVYENKDICKKCGGNCCKSMGCHLSPEDIKGGVTYDSLKALLDTGNVSIDWWEGNPFSSEDEIDFYSIFGSTIKVFYLRMRNYLGPIVDGSWGGRCCLLTDTGCTLSFEDRPKGARLLVPTEGNECEQQYSKQQCAKDWFEYQDLFKLLIKQYN